MRVASAKVRPAMHLLGHCVGFHRRWLGSHLHLDERKDLPLFGQPSRHTTVERQQDA
jgi:hypothetical protein